jgi:hypothetical protein
MNRRISIGISLGLDGLLGLKGVLDIDVASWRADGAAMDSDKLEAPPGDDEWAAWAVDPATGEEIPLYTRSEVDAFTARPNQVKGDAVKEA